MECDAEISGSPAPGTVTVAAIGGPLSFSVRGGDPNHPAPKHDLNSGGTAEDATKPFYLQYLGYDESLNVPAGYQSAQYGQVSPAVAQISPGTKYKWAPDAGLALQPGTTDDDSPWIFGTKGSGGSGLKVKCTFTYTDPNDSTLTGSADDDSDSTPPSGSKSANSNYYRFDVHAPKSLTNTLTSHVTASPPTYQGYSVSDTYTMTLIDDGGVPMPSVYVAERLAASLTSTAGNWITAGVGSSCGTFMDYIGVSNSSQPYTYAANPNSPLYAGLQKYFAGTNVTTSTSTVGVLVGQFNISVWTDTTSHTPPSP